MHAESSVRLARRRAARIDLDVCGLTFLAILLGLVGLGTRSIVLDEATSVDHARLGLGSLYHLLVSRGGDPNMSLYYVLLHPWVSMFGESEAAVRSISVLFAALAVPPIVCLGSRLFGRRAGLFAGLLLALDAFFVQFAQTARSYSLVVFLVTLSSSLFVRELEQPSRAGRLGYVLASALAVYAHYFAAYVLLAQLVTLLAMRRRAVFTRTWLGMAAAIAALSAPEAFIAFRVGGGPIDWIPQPVAHDLWQVPVDLVGGSPILLLTLLLAGGYGAVLAVRRHRAWPFGFVAVWALLPLLLSFAVSFAQPMFITYYLIVILPALVLLGAGGIASVRSPALAGVLLALVVSLSCVRLVDWYESAGNANWRDATRYVLDATQAGDAIVFYPPYARTPFDYYERRSDASGPQELSSGAGRRVWLVIRESDARLHETEVRALEASVGTAHRRAVIPTFQGVGVELYEPAAG